MKNIFFSFVAILFFAACKEATSFDPYSYYDVTDCSNSKTQIITENNKNDTIKVAGIFKTPLVFASKQTDSFTNVTTYKALSLGVEQIVTVGVAKEIHHIVILSSSTLSLSGEQIKIQLDVLDHTTGLKSFCLITGKLTYDPNADKG
jgi:hypothetical protein